MNKIQIRKEREPVSVGIVGGGITGIAAALKLAKSGDFSVTVFERENQIGGLSSSYVWEDLTCDRFYHVILPNDTHLLQFIEDLGLKSSLNWRNTKTGFYGQGRLVSFSTIGDFLKFPFLSFPEKVRLGVGIFYANQQRNAGKLDSITARSWLTKIFGVRIYINIWEPLLRSKFGDARDKISASLIWATIKRLYGTRGKVDKQEKLGYIHGGYKAIFDTARRKIEELGGRILTGANIEKAFFNKLKGKIIVLTNSQIFEFDNLLLTVPSPEVLRLIENYREYPDCHRLGKVEYLGVICLLLVLKRSLSPYYVINLLDRTLPFTGVVESTNVIAPACFKNRHLVYLPRYVTENEKILEMPDEEIETLFLEKLQTILPNFRSENILHTKIFREKYTQPVLKTGFLKNRLGFRSLWPGLYLINSSMICDSTLNNNAMVKLARDAVETMIEENKEAGKGFKQNNGQ